MSRRNVWFWRDVWPLLRDLARSSETSVNRLVNLAVLSFVGACDEEGLKVWAEIGRLCRKDAELRRVSSTMLRSGSYLPQYADRLFRPKWDKDGEATYPQGKYPFYYEKPRKGDVPLKALNPKEENVMRRLLAERERGAERIAELLNQVLPKEKFRLKPRRRSRSRRRDKHKSVKNVRTRKEE